MGSVKRTHPDVVQFERIGKQARREDQRHPLSHADLLRTIEDILARHVGDDDAFIRHLRSYLEEHR